MKFQNTTPLECTTECRGQKTEFTDCTRTGCNITGWELECRKLRKIYESTPFPPHPATFFQVGIHLRIQIQRGVLEYPDAWSPNSPRDPPDTWPFMHLTSNPPRELPWHWPSVHQTPDPPREFSWHLTPGLPQENPRYVTLHRNTPDICPFTHLTSDSPR